MTTFLRVWAVFTGLVALYFVYLASQTLGFFTDAIPALGILGLVLIYMGVKSERRQEAK